MATIKRGAFFAAISMLANFGLPLAAVPFLSRALGVNGFGELMIAYATTVVLCQLVDFGFILSAARQVAVVGDQKQLVARLFSNVQMGRAILALAALFLLSLLLMLDVLPVSTWVLLASTLPAIVGTALQATWFFNGRAMFGWLALANVTSKTSYFCAVVFLVDDSADQITAAFAFGSAYIVSAFVMLIGLRKEAIKWSPKIDFDEVFTTMRQGVRPFLSMAFLSIHMQVLVAGVGIVSGPAMAGVLATADRIVRGVAAVSIPFANAMFPIFSRLYLTHNSDAGVLRRKALAGMAVVGSLGSLVLFFQADFIANIFLPGAHSDLITVLRIVSLVPLFVCIGVVYGGLTLVPAGLDKAYLRSIIIAETIGGICFVLLLFSGNRFVGAWTVLIAEASLGLAMFFIAQVWIRCSITKKSENQAL